MEQKNDLSSARVGDILYHVRFGWCDVIGVDKEKRTPLLVRLPNEDRWHFNFEGKNLESDPFPTLFWSKPTIIYPPPPKRVVKKKVEGWVGFGRFKDTNPVYVREEIYETEVKANQFADQDPSIPRAVFISHEYEEEV